MNSDLENFQTLLNQIRDYINRYILQNQQSVYKIQMKIYGEGTNLLDLWKYYSESVVFNASSYDKDVLQQVGLTEKQLDFKLRTLRFLVEHDTGKICSFITTILSSLGFANHMAEGLKELIDIICKLRDIIR